MKIPVSYRTPATEVYRRQIMSVQGPEKTGKTHFACTAPDPILLLNTDMGDEGVVTEEKFPGRTIYIVDITPGSEFLAHKEGEAAYEQAWAEFTEAYHWGLGSCATVVLDKADQIWELARLKHFGKLSNIRPHHYTEVNNTFRYLLKAADRRKDVNLILIHNMKEEWLDERNTGRLIRAGFKETGGLVQSSLTTFRRDTEFGCVVDFCRQNMELVGQELSGIFFTYEQFLEQVFG